MWVRSQDQEDPLEEGEVRALGIGGGREGEEWRGVCAVLKNWKTVCYLQWLKLPGEVQVALEQQGLGFGLSP